MMGNKRLLVFGFMTFLLLGAAVMALAGGGPEPPPYAFTEVGPSITGDLTLEASGNSFNTTLKGKCGKDQVTVTANLKTVKPADTLTAQEIQTSAANYFMKAVLFQIKGTCKPASGPGDLMVKSLTGLQKKKGKKGVWTAKATLVYIAPK
ncbi:MAG: hypothetical protein FJ128_05535 [Deltaproteobacteria bacterium]|nr:hypothetical protein [Deltaproteobacteria bacterium]